MIRVLIADDEKRIRDGLAATIPWAELGMEVVGTAAHGEAALELARSKQPHIILTDVRMPRMDGLEFLSQVRAFLPRVQVVILSGYDDFSYAQRAVKLGVSEYLVKPVGTQDIVKTLIQLKENWERAEPLEPAREGVQRPTDAIVAAVRRGDAAAAFAALGQWRAGTAAPDLAQTRTQAIALVDELVQDLRREGFEFRDDSPASAQEFATVLGVEHRTQVDVWLEEQVRALAAFVDRNRLSNHTLMIRRALTIIDEKCTGDLTVETVAAAVGLSPNYFSHLFKRVRGQGFKDHLNLVRIEKAQKMLSLGGVKVYEAALAAGFSDYKYFSAVFKKVTGTTPTHYSRAQSVQPKRGSVERP